MNNDLYPMNAAELMDRAVHVYKKSFGRQLAFSAIFGVITYVVSVVLFTIILVILFSVTAFSPIFGGGIAYGSGMILSVLMLALIIVLPLVFLWYAISSAGHCAIAGTAFFGYKAKFPFRQLPHMVGRIFCTLLAQAVASLPFVGVAVLLVVTGIFQTLFARMPWVFVLINSVFLILYMFYLNVFSLSIAVAVFERKTFFNALIRSWQLIKGEYWKIAGIRLVWVVSTFFIYMALSGVLVLFNMLVGGLAATMNIGPAGAVLVGISSLLTMIVSIVVPFIIGPLDGIFHATLYFNQRIKREGLDIEARLGRLMS